MKKLTATIFASLLTVVSVGAASANIASQGYVDDQVKTRVATETYSAEIGEVSKDNMGTTTATTVVGGIKEAMTQANANALAIEGLTGEGAGSINAALDEIEAGYQAADKEITDTIGEVPEGKTVIGMIDDAVKAGAYDDTELSGKIDTLEGKVNNETTGLAATKDIADANKTAIATLNGDATTDGSVAKSVKDAVDPVNTQATANKDAIATLNGDEETEGSVDYKVKAATDTLTTNIDGKQAKSTAAYQLGNEEGGWTALTDAEKAALASGATAENVAKIATNETAIAAINNEENGILAQAKTYVDGKASANAENITKNTTAIAAVKEVADAAIPAPTGECASTDAKCVLTYNNSTYAWEVIARGTTAQTEER